MTPSFDRVEQSNITGLLDDLRQKRRISEEEAIELAFREGLKKARESVAEWRDLCRREGLLFELNQIRLQIREKRAMLMAADVRNSQAIFESYQTANEVSNLLILYHVLRADIRTLVLLGKKLGIELDGEQDLTEIPGLHELIDRYFFRAKREFRDRR